MVKKNINYILLLGQVVFGQVGIGTTTLNSTLDIQASNQVNPANTDEILIPRIDVF